VRPPARNGGTFTGPALAGKRPVKDSETEAPTQRAIVVTPDTAERPSGLTTAMA